MFDGSVWAIAVAIVTVISAGVGAIASLVGKAAADTITAEAAAVRKRRDDEFQVRRDRIEDLHRKITAVANSSGTVVAGWKFYKHSINSEQKTLPPDVESLDEVMMIVGLHLPELEDVRLDLSNAYLQFLKARQAMYSEEAGSLTELSKSQANLTRSCRLFLTTLEQLFRSSRDEHLAIEDHVGPLRQRARQIVQWRKKAA
ncbi:MAG: hypothetical protein ABL904_09440 [Hyphomicrobiaceae bacterium]